MAETSSDPSTIERDLDQTRSRLGSHLNELQDRLSPGQVLDDLMGYFRGSEGAEFGSSLLQNVRDNPMPAAVTAIGLAWLMASKPSGGSQPSSSPAGQGRSSSAQSYFYGGQDHAATTLRLQEAEATATRQPAESESTYAARLNDVRGQALGLSRHAQETADSFGERVRGAMAAVQSALKDTVQSVGDQVGSAASAATGGAGSLGATAQNAANSAMQSISGSAAKGAQAGSNVMAAIADSPVMLGILGLAAGAILGALVPQTEQEEAALGDLAGQTREATTSVASQAIESGKRVARSVLEKGRDSVQAQELGSKSPGELVDAALSGELTGSASTAAKDALEAGDEAIRKEVTPPPHS
jgi:hypothetical protein